MKTTIARTAGIGMLGWVLFVSVGSLSGCSVKHLDELDRYLSGSPHSGTMYYDEEPHDSEWPTEEQPEFR